MTRHDWVISLMEAEHDLEMAQDAAHDHDGSEIDAPQRIEAARARIAQLQAVEPPK